MSDLKLMRSNLEDRFGFLELQEKILECACFIDKICREYDIDYCLMGGSALGAKRHGGFIPWDDDLDVFMTPDNYEKFRRVFQETVDKDKYYLQEWGLTKGMVTIAKVRLNQTTYIEESFRDWDMHQGIFVDIFILHTCPNCRLSQWRQFVWAKYVITKGLANRNYSRRKGIVGLALKFAALLPEKFLIGYGLKQVYKYRGRKTNYFCNFLGKAVFKNAIYKREFFEKTVYAPFETVELRVPEKLHEFLTDRFGDYMTPPSPERIKWEQHAESWDVNKDFRETLPQIRDFADEKKLI